MQKSVQHVKAILASLHRGDSGQDLIEYALIAALIALGAIAGMGFVAVQINLGFSAIGSILSSYV